MNENATHEKQRKTGTKILLQIMVLLLIVFVASGLVSLGFYLRSTSNLTNRSKEKLMESKAQDMSSGFGYVADTVAEEVEETLGTSGINTADLAESVMKKEIMPVQTEISTRMEETVDKGVLGTELLVLVVPAIPPALQEPAVFMSSNEELVYSDVPEEVSEIYESGKTYGILEDGIPQWNLEGEQLVVFKEYSLSGLGMSGPPCYPTAVRSVQQDIAEINEYYNNEKKDINILMSIVIISFSLALFIIIFVILRYLIRSRITKPIEELSEAADKVMEGDLDVVVPVNEGEEFANLKTAFNEMLKSIRDIISRSIGEKDK